MYRLSTSLLEVKGIGEKTAQDLNERGFSLVRDLLLNLPLHYLDRSTLGKISELNEERELTFIGEVTSVSNFYRRPRSIQSATVKDDTGRVKMMWFNNPFILKKIQKGKSYVFSGKLSAKGSVVQPVVAGVGEDSLHTGRIVPVYSGSFGVKVGTLRRIYKEVLDNLAVDGHQDLSQVLPDQGLSKLLDTLEYLHFPETQEQVVLGKERLALEELLLLIKKSNQIRDEWQKLSAENHPPVVKVDEQDLIPKSIPYALTKAQLRCVDELVADIGESKPMNRILIGDVGAGKTVVAGTAAYHLVKAGLVVALVAPTKILAAQHLETLKSLFPDIKIELLSSKQIPDLKKGGIVVGTHKVINHLFELNPSMIIYDEQHRFGVSHRSSGKELAIKPHTLTMTATPIPRTLMLTIFSHLDLSVIDELPPGRMVVETYLSKQSKLDDFYAWVEKLNAEQPSRQILIVCPFIEPSDTEGFTEIASVETEYEKTKAFFKKRLVVGKLHSRLKKAEQEQVIADLFAGKIQVLVTTPIVEVGVDLPAATVVAIHNAERFGLASLHQIRGRVGRRNEQGYCVLFSSSKAEATKKRLQMFTKEHQGMKLAEFDLSNRGAGDIFGLAQSGEDGLRFANWTNLELISTARKIYNELSEKEWSPLLKLDTKESSLTPMAN